MVWLCLCAALASPVWAGSAPVGESLLVPGGTARLLETAGIRAPVERDRALLVLIRVLYQTRSITPESGPVLGLQKYLEAAAREKRASDSVPALLPPAVWGQAVFGGRVGADRLVMRILTDREATLLYYGLFSLDDETLAYFIGHPTLISTIHKRAAGAFAAVADAISVRGGRVQLPGAASSAEGWEALVGAPAANPELFITRLLRRDQGRLASLFDTVGRLDAGQQAFAMGNGREDLRALYSAFAGFDEGWTIADTPFTRFAMFDASMILERIDGATGAMWKLPGERVVWQALFRIPQPPAGPDTESPAEAGGLVVTAPWLIDRFRATPSELRSVRLDALLFAQRLRAAAARERTAPDTASLAETLKAFPECEALIVSLEQMGFADARDYAQAVRAAAALTDGVDQPQKALRLAMFQGAIALVARMRAVGTLNAATARDLCLKLFPLAVKDATQFPGAMARWIETDLLPALPGATASQTSNAEGQLVDALAGLAVKRAVPVVEWEGARYRVDPAAGESARLRRILRKLGGNDLDGALELARLVSGITAPSSSAADVRAKASRLAELAPTLFDSRRTTLFRFSIADARDTLLERARQLGEGRADRASGAVQRGLAGGLAVVLAEVIASRVYATAVGDPDSAVLLGENPALRHDFALGAVAEAGPWTVAVIPPAGPGSPALGSLLALDRALAQFWLRPTTLTSPSVRPLLWEHEVQGFAESVVALDPLDLSDVGRDTLVAALQRGRGRIAAAGSRPTDLDGLAAEAGVDGWRRRLIRLAAADDPGGAASYFSLGEVLALGLAGSEPPDFDAWGPSMRPINGSLAQHLSLRLEWHEMAGRPRMNLVATRVVDLQLRVAELLAEMKLPAALAPGIMACATWDLAMNARMADRDDWLAVIRAAQRLSAGRMADYVSALTADGPLVLAAK